jgi:hypothetical protein
VSNEEPLINYNKNIMMTNEHYVVALNKNWQQRRQQLESKMLKRRSYWYPNV